MDELILDACHRRGWIAADVGDKVRDLLRRGLNAEQALLGCRLVDIGRYGEALSEVTGLPFVQVQDAAVPSVAGIGADACRTFGICPLAQDGKELFVGFTRRPEENEFKDVKRLVLGNGFRLRPFAILRSDWRRFVKEPGVRPRASRLFHSIRSLAEAGGLHSVQIVPRGPHATVSFSHQTHIAPSLSFPAARLPAFRLSTQRVAPRYGWNIEPDAARQGFRWTREEPFPDAPHPMEDRLPDVSSPGLWVLVGVDPYLLSRLCDATAERMDAADASGQERALHAALAGRKVVATAPSIGDWWRPAAEADIPVHLLRCHHAAEGEAWESIPV